MRQFRHICRILVFVCTEKAFMESEKTYFQKQKNIRFFVTKLCFFGYIDEQKNNRHTEQRSVESQIPTRRWILFCTKSFKAFGRAFLFVVGKRGNSLAAYKESLHAVRMVMSISAVFGGLRFLIGLMNCIRSTDLSSMEGFGWVLRGASVAILSLFYPLLICVILMPVYFMLKKHIEEK